MNNPFLYGDVDVFSQPLEIAIGPVLPPSLSKGKRKHPFSSFPSPEPNSARPRRTAKAIRRRERSPSPVLLSPFGDSEWWESDVSLCWRCRKHNVNVIYAFLLPSLVCRQKNSRFDHPLMLTQYST